MSNHLLTAVEQRWRTEVGGGGRCLSWSPAGRLLAVGADGRALVDEPGELTTPLGPDPVDAGWLGSQRVVVIDAVVGAVFAGSGVVTNHPVPGARRFGHHGGSTLVVGADVVAVFGPDRGVEPPTLVPTGVGQGHALAWFGAGLWAVGGSSGVALVDANRGHVTKRVSLEGVRALASAQTANRLVAADLGGDLHLIDRTSADRTVVFGGFTDPVRHLAFAPDGDLLVTATEDDFAWWEIDESGRSADEPEWAGEHDGPVTALAMSRSRMVASGDASGAVRVWSPWLTDHPVAQFALADEIVALQWHPEGSALAAADMSGEVAVVDVSPGVLA